MGAPELIGDAALPELDGLGLNGGRELLNRAAEVGLLTVVADGVFAIHPALPTHFRQLFQDTYGPSNSPSALRAIRAYTAATSMHGDYGWGRYQRGDIKVVDVLIAEEANLLHARELARNHGWWNRVMQAMQGLRVLYGHTSRNARWARLVDDLQSDLMDPISGEPRRGREDAWRFYVDYCVELAMKARDNASALRLHEAAVAFDRERVARLLAHTSEVQGVEQQDQIRSLVGALITLGTLLAGQGDARCVGAFEEAAALLQLVNDVHQQEAIIAYDLVLQP
jgi:hypothetical protein